MYLCVLGLVERMWAFYENLWGKGDHLNGDLLSDTPASHLGTVNQSGCPVSPQTVARIRTHELYHGGICLSCAGMFVG